MDVCLELELDEAGSMEPHMESRLLSWPGRVVIWRLLHGKPRSGRLHDKRYVQYVIIDCLLDCCRPRVWELAHTCIKHA